MVPKARAPGTWPSGCLDEEEEYLKIHDAHSVLKGDVIQKRNPIFISTNPRRRCHSTTAWGCHKNAALGGRCDPKTKLNLHLCKSWKKTSLYNCLGMSQNAELGGIL
ncbi:hypothetical protein CEXT_534011 [Caerostris extrusa]|uniref:Uncharacterized protein n=1 Tax=Caerostris extrusa TaxID=172846 RepID=A0AAV4P0V3_CAEEX|nr:hypothetical protein CEXT_534011 [Caerostris extrusa]